ncbi:MAG TPA: hypothetical protein VGJ61_05765 [Solirubrobacterales bacterium]
MARPCRLGLVAIAASTVLFCAPQASAKNPAAPTGPDQPLADGCQRSDFGIGFDTSPEWVYVYRNTAIRQAQGLVRVAHPAKDDSVLEHDAYDANANLVVAKKFRYLLGGSQSAQTGNFAPDAEEGGRLHFEWESGTLPLFAWPTDGDRATIWGSWIWDCGHWSTGPANIGGTIVGERTELHPLNGIVVNRASLSGPGKKNGRETDTFFSNQGTRAHAVEQCALSHNPVPGGPYPQYDSGFGPCAQERSNRIQPLARSYKYLVPAPPKPSGGAKLRFKILNRVGGKSGSDKLKVKPNGLAVTTKVKRGTNPIQFGQSFFLWWTPNSAKPGTTFKVTLGSLRINQSDPDPIYGATTSPWNLYLDLNGSWTLLNTLVPQLGAVSDGETIPINKTLPVHAPNGSGLWLQVSGRECDEPGGTTVLGIAANLVYPCPANTTEQNPNVFKLLSNDDTGTILDIFRSAKAALGTHSTTAQATVNFPHSGPISFGDGQQGNGGYVLNYSVKKG